MRIPKLKYYYYAMTSDAYIDFACRRELDVNAALTIDLLTGQITKRDRLILAASTALADEEFRQRQNGYTAPVYILRIPRELILRPHLVRLSDNLYQYLRSLRIEHCGVERIELTT